MKANFDRLIDGAHSAAGATRSSFGDGPVDLALLISCVGRKLVLGQRVEEELEGVREQLGAAPFTVSTRTARSARRPRTPPASCTTRR